jgi:hypothetical protein
MKSTIIRVAARIAAVAVLLLVGATPAASSRHASTANPKIKARVGAYMLAFTPKSGAIAVSHGGSAVLQIRELGGNAKVNLLKSTKRITHSGTSWTLSGNAPWASFQLTLTASSPTSDGQPSGSALIGLTLKVTPSKDAPTDPGPDVTLVHAPAAALKEYAAAPPVAGNNLFLSNAQFGSTILYYSNYTALGPYFDRTRSGVTQPNFPYLRAGTKGSLVGVSRGSFGYVPPPSSLGSLPHRKTTVVVSSYLYLEPAIPSAESDIATAYLRALDTVDSAVARPSVPAADWQTLAARSARDIADPSNWVTVGGHQYLRSYVSDTRSAPELLTQAGVLAGIRAYEVRYNTSAPFAATLDADLATYYDPVYGTVMNSLPHDPSARGESWYFVNNLISLLQLAQTGDAAAKALLLQSVDAVIKLAHVNGYEFPQNFAYSDLNGSGSQVEHDVAGGYAWLMLGLYDLTGKAQYLDESKASIAHMAGTGFDLSYETHMSAYTAAAAQRLYTMTGDTTYHGNAVLALANLFHAVRLWDCTYGMCRKGSGYHTYMGLNPLPWSDYVAMLEQYEAWLGLQSYMQYAQNEPAYATNLVKAFIQYSPRTLQYSLPPLLPSGAASSAAGEYPFVPRNNLSWHIPLEDLREGEVTSGAIGQELYGAGGPFMFAAYAQ